ncbi:MAG TPA: nucleotidyltransferase domain-containing protein [Gemmatimonadaceae bacterium]
MAQMTLDELTTQLRAAYGSELRAVVLYGSAAAGQHIAKRSDYNVLVIVDGLDPQHLIAASATSRAWSDAGNPAPLTLTTAEWRGSSDIFPMEYADILDRNKVLFGTLPLDGVQVDRKDLRLQVEQEAMGKLLKLRQGVLASGNDPKRQLELLAASASAIMIIFRAVLRLHGDQPQADNAALGAAVGALAGFDPAPFQRVVRHVRNESTLQASDAPGVLAGYLSGMERLVSYLDSYQADS